MKLEIINPSTQEVVEIYSVPDLSILDFQQWRNENEIIIHLDSLLDKVVNLDSKDPETKMPTFSNPEEVDFYLPDPLKKQVFSVFKDIQTDMEVSSEEFEDKISRPALKSSTILTAVVQEILQNHHQRTDYKVRISDG